MTFILLSAVLITAIFILIHRAREHSNKLKELTVNKEINLTTVTQCIDTSENIAYAWPPLWTTKLESNCYYV